ncbi:uncharacterized protein LOC108867142 isoform X2 [Pyrus x bretschneideri]|uniref:uncharacterized protein LOC108867142 isoform X2 n=1 Tax=Pyrus x bretschneideri TaxID=225117 RepID=UPI00202F804C|nr:uncharacterized protein LOC108867142 isoform X2 [Pyrus x bretschneideri]
MQNLFRDQSEEEEGEVDSKHKSNPQLDSVILLPWMLEYGTVVLLHALLSAENSTGLIKEGYIILLKHFRYRELRGRSLCEYQA